MNADAIQVAVAGGVTLVTSLLVLRAGSIDIADHADAAERSPETPVIEAAVPAPSDAGSTPVTRAAPGLPGRPRILTGEPAVAAEQRKPAPRRAMKLVAGIAVLAVAGAFGLLAFVRALISMFDSIGG